MLKNARKGMPSEKTNHRSGDTPSVAGSVSNSAMAALMGVPEPPPGILNPQLAERFSPRNWQEARNRQIPSAELEADRLSSGVRSGSPESVKSAMGEKLGADFSGVRFHTGPDDAPRADSIGASAFTSGMDVYFGSRGFDAPIAAHELVHTVQQGAVESAVSTVSAPLGGVQMAPDDAYRRRMTAPTTGAYAAKDFTEQTDIHRARFEGAIEDKPDRQIPGLGTAMQNLGALDQVPELRVALDNLRELVAGGKDYNSTPEGRQYLLGVFSTAEHALSRYIQNSMQAFAGTHQNDVRFRLKDMDTYENYTQLLEAIRNEHRKTVDRIAGETRNNQGSTELPVYEGDIADKSPEEREKKLKAWRYITRKKEAPSAAGEGRLKWADGAEENEQFRSEVFSHGAKTLETDVGTDLWDMMRRSGKTLTMMPSSRSNVDALSPEAASLRAAPTGAGGGALPNPNDYMEMRNGGSNIMDIMQSALAKKERAQGEKSGIKLAGQDGRPDGYYDFGSGSDVVLRSEMGTDVRNAGGDVGDNDVLTQTSPWIIFAHELGHAAKSALGTRVKDGRDNESLPTASKERLNDFSNNSEELANWYIENMVRAQSETGHKAVYNPLRLYMSNMYTESATGMKVKDYIGAAHESYRRIQDYELENQSPIFSSYSQEFRTMAGNRPELYSADAAGSSDTPEQRLKPASERRPGTALPSVNSMAASRASEFITSHNMPKIIRERSHRMLGSEGLIRTQMAADRQNPGPAAGAGGQLNTQSLPPMEYFRMHTVKEAVERKKDVIRQNFRPVDLTPLEGSFFNRRTYAKDTEMQELKKQLETYNAGGRDNITPADLQYLIGRIDRYITANMAARGGQGQHHGRRSALTIIRHQLQELLDKTRTDRTSASQSGPQGAQPAVRQ